ncbi:PREDICTED: uncharacterized protein LOC102023101 [Chinchilla lanigera]|uniref:uncharacterized protein LOC102023101 n=1 Tax=Chinchilla lanigera TaxID=34839 RepID=UPI0006967D58|nr:PREDICTED: uncharacterized protein LOC102023101 [Chinchilla lanigera]
MDSSSAHTGLLTATLGLFVTSTSRVSSICPAWRGQGFLSAWTAEAPPRPPPSRSVSRSERGALPPGHQVRLDEDTAGQEHFREAGPGISWPACDSFVIGRFGWAVEAPEVELHWGHTVGDKAGPSPAGWLRCDTWRGGSAAIEAQCRVTLYGFVPTVCSPDVYFTSARGGQGHALTASPLPSVASPGESSGRRGKLSKSECGSSKGFGSADPANTGSERTAQEVMKPHRAGEVGARHSLHPTCPSSKARGPCLSPSTVTFPPASPPPGRLMLRQLRAVVKLRPSPQPSLSDGFHSRDARKCLLQRFPDPDSQEAGQTERRPRALPDRRAHRAECRRLGQFFRFRLLLPAPPGEAQRTEETDSSLSGRSDLGERQESPSIRVDEEETVQSRLQTCSGERPGRWDERVKQGRILRTINGSVSSCSEFTSDTVTQAQAPVTNGTVGGAASAAHLHVLSRVISGTSSACKRQAARPWPRPIAVCLHTEDKTFFSASSQREPRFLQPPGLAEDVGFPNQAVPPHILLGLSVARAPPGQLPSCSLWTKGGYRTTQALGCSVYVWGSPCHPLCRPHLQAVCGPFPPALGAQRGVGVGAASPDWTWPTLMSEGVHFTPSALQTPRERLAAHPREPGRRPPLLGGSSFLWGGGAGSLCQ